MNQTTQVLDGYTWVEGNHLKLDLIHLGQILPCYLHGKEKHELIDFYLKNKFNIEDLIEQKVEADEFNTDGELWIDTSLLLFN